MVSHLPFLTEKENECEWKHLQVGLWQPPLGFPLQWYNLFINLKYSQFLLTLFL